MNLSRNLFIILLFWGGFAQAQDSKVNSGIIEYEKGNYKKSLEALNQALKHPSMLKTKNQPRAYYYRSKAWLGAANKALVDRDVTWLTANPKAVLHAYEDCQQAEKRDNGKWTEEIKAHYSTLRISIMQYGLAGLTTLQRTKDEAQKQEAYTETMQYFKVAAAIQDNDYVVYDMMAQAESARKFASKETLTYSKQAIERYHKHKPTTPDPIFGYAYYRKALVERYTLEELETAWNTVRAGIDFLSQERERAQRMADLKRREVVIRKMKPVQKDLERFELDILLNSPDLRDVALKKFEKAIQDEPTNYNIHLAYASLLEKVNEEMAMVIYEKAIRIDPSREEAYFNLGAIYNGQAVEFYKKSNEEADFAKAAQWNEKIDAVFEKAYVQFQKAHEINPKSLETINALLQISIRLEKLEDYQKYKKAKKALQGG